jgi:energy-converting hydrogenase Eha subunit C
LDEVFLLSDARQFWLRSQAFNMGNVNMSKRTQMTIGLAVASVSLLLSIISLIKTCTYSSSDFDAGKLVWQFANQILAIILLVIYIISVWKKKTSFAWATFFGICLLQISNLLLILSIIVPINGSIGISLANMKLQFMWLALFLGCLVIGVLGTISESETRDITNPSESLKN